MGYGITRKPKNMGQAVRFFCLECMGGYDEYKDTRGKKVASYMPQSTVRECPDINCQLYPYRFGKCPSRSEKAKERATTSPPTFGLPVSVEPVEPKVARNARKAKVVLGMGSSLF